MPNSPSAAKRMRSDMKKQERNQAALSELKNLNKKLFESTKEFKQAEELSKRVISRYDHAVSQGIIPRKRADRKKSRIAKLLKKLQG